MRTSSGKHTNANSLLVCPNYTSLLAKESTCNSVVLMLSSEYRKETHPMDLDEAEVDQRMWELYVMECERVGVKADMGGFFVWRDERE